MKQTIISVVVGILLVAGYYIGKSFYLKPELTQGDTAYEFEGKLLDGTDFKLSDQKGKYLLLDFWGSWCKPCRKSHPELISLHKQFHHESFKDASGFEIISFGVERNRESWLKAIKDDSLYWPHHMVSTDLFENPVVSGFNVKQIPTKFLINPAGVIIAVDPSISRISKLLHNRLLITKPK